MSFLIMSITVINRKERGYTNFFIDAEKTAILDVGMCYDAPSSISALRELLKAADSII